MGREYTYYGVEVEPFFDDKLYYYLADADYRMNAYVLVPFGRKQLLGVIKEVKRCSEQDAPYPPEKTRKIIRKATDDEIRGEPEPGEEIDDTDDSSWTRETPPRLDYDGEPVEISPLELKIVQWLQNDKDMHPLRDIQRRYPKYSPRTVERALEHLRKLGVLQGGNWLAGNMYYVADGVSIGGSARSDAFMKLETIFESASQEELENQAYDSAAIIQETLLGLGLEHVGQAIVSVGRYGTGHGGALTESEEQMVHALYDDEDDTSVAEDMCRFMQVISLENAERVVRNMCKNDMLAMDVLMLAMSFAYANGHMDDEIAQSLDEMLDTNLVTLAANVTTIGHDR